MKNLKALRVMEGRETSTKKIQIILPRISRSNEQSNQKSPFTYESKSNPYQLKKQVDSPQQKKQKILGQTLKKINEIHQDKILNDSNPIIRSSQRLSTLNIHLGKQQLLTPKIEKLKLNPITPRGLESCSSSVNQTTSSKSESFDLWTQKDLSEKTKINLDFQALYLNRSKLLKNMNTQKLKKGDIQDKKIENLLKPIVQERFSRRNI